MKKIIITEQQYKRLIISESDDKTNNLKRLFFGVSILLGYNLTGQNKIIGDNVLEDKTNIESIGKIFMDENKLKNLIDLMEEKGIENAEGVLKEKIDEFVKKYNDYSQKLGCEHKLGVHTKELISNL